MKSKFPYNVYMYDYFLLLYMSNTNHMMCTRPLYMYYYFRLAVHLILLLPVYYMRWT